MDGLQKGCAQHQLSGDEAKKVIVFALKDKKAEQRKFEPDSEGKYEICAECASTVTSCVLVAVQLDATGKQQNIWNRGCSTTCW